MCLKKNNKKAVKAAEHLNPQSKCCQRSLTPEKEKPVYPWLKEHGAEGFHGVYFSRVFSRLKLEMSEFL